MGGDYIMLPAIIFLAILPGNFFTYYYLTKAVPVKKTVAIYYPAHSNSAGLLGYQ